MQQPDPATAETGDRRAADRERNAAARRLRQAEMLLAAYHRVATSTTLDDSLRELVGIMAAETGAEWGTIFLEDPRTGELFSRMMHGSNTREIRILDGEGIAGLVFQSGESLLIEDAYAHPAFNASVDAATGLRTRNILAVPMRKTSGGVIGVCEVINKKNGAFTAENAELLAALGTQAAITLESAHYAERMEQSRRQELEFLDLVADITAEIDLSSVLRKVVRETTRLLDAERSTLFLNDEKTGELWSEVGEGLQAAEIRIPNTRGIAGAVFTSGETVNIPHAYADLRFNPAVDRQTGFFTRSILCVPVVSKSGKTIGVTQVLNKRGGAFTAEDESRLKAFSAQVSIGLENAKLFKDVQRMKNYTESMLESMSNGVITLGEDARIVTCNEAAARILAVRPEQLVGRLASEYFGAANDWVAQRLARVAEGSDGETVMDAELRFGAQVVALNLTVLPLRDAEQKRIGMLLMIDDITSEKRVKSTMSRYMDPAIADQLLASGQEMLGGKSVETTALFSDLRGFTTLTEQLGATGTVSLLNEYFTLMVECIQQEGGMLDKFIGDAIMAAFGIPLPHEDDADRAVRAAIAMVRTLHQWNARRGGASTLDMGVGLNTDVVVSGNIGSPRRMDFTIIGDGVNLASRLESACKQYGARILLSDNTRRKLRGTYRLREVDLVVVKGKTEPVAIHEVLDYHDEAGFPNLMEAVGYFGSGLAHFRHQDWERARRAFGEAARLNPRDLLPGIYLERVDYLTAHPPGADWNGVWLMKTK